MGLEAAAFGRRAAEAYVQGFTAQGLEFPAILHNVFLDCQGLPLSWQIPGDGANSF